MKILARLVQLVLSATLLISCKERAFNSSETKFYGTDSRLGVLKYKGVLHYKPYSDTNLQRVKLEAEKLSSNPDVEFRYNWASDGIVGQLRSQINFLFSAFKDHPFYENKPAVISNKPKVRIISVQALNEKGEYDVHYSFEDKIVLHEKLVGNQKKYVHLSFYLPREVRDIYDLGCVGGCYFQNGKRKSTIKNLCTDENYNDESDYWYFWNPFKKGAKNQNCPLRKRNLIKVQGKVNLVSSTKRTYPLYQKMYAPGKEVKIVLLVGVDEKLRRLDDLGRQSFDDTYKALISGGRFKEDRAQSGDQRSEIHRYLTAERGQGTQVSLEMFLVNPNEGRFLDLADWAMKNADVFIYDGHSGLGEHLKIKVFKDYLERSKFSLPKNLYQVFYFNGCSTFAYYNEDFYKAKSDRSNIDIVTTSVGATFDTGSPTDVSFINDILDGDSWQTIIDNIYKVDPSQSALTHVNWDEDNPVVQPLQ